MAATKKDKWSALSIHEAPVIGNGSVVRLNEFEFMAATEANKDDYDKTTPENTGFYIFNTRNNAWKLWLKYPTDWSVKDPTIMYDPNKEAIYLFVQDEDEGKAKIINIDFKTKEFAINQLEERYEENIADTKEEIHMIGGWESNKHVKFTKTDQKIQEIHTFDSLDRLYGTLAVYVASSNVILIFGGATASGQRECHIREFSLKTCKWRKIENIVYEYYIGKALVTMDGKHVLLSPVYEDDVGAEQCDTMFILDILDDGKYEFRKSKIKIPDDFCGADYVHRMMAITGGGNDDILVSGFIRNLFEKNGMRMPYDDIINLIGLFYDSEVLHLIGGSYDFGNSISYMVGHYTIVLSSVLDDRMFAR